MMMTLECFKVKNVVYIQDLALRNVDQNSQQTLLTTMELSRKIIRTIISIRLYKLVSKANRGDCCETEYNIDKDVNYKYSHSKI